MSIPVTVLSIEVGLFSLFFLKAPPIEPSLDAILFYGLLCLALLFFAVSACFVFRALTGYPLSLLSSPLDIRKYYLGTYKDLRGRQVQNAATIARAKFRYFLSQQYIECNQTNIFQNDRKSNNLRRAKIATIVSVIFLAMALIPFVYYRATDVRADVQRIEIIKPAQ